jgi:hypothetical protein
MPWSGADGKIWFTRSRDAAKKNGFARRRGGAEMTCARQRHHFINDG